MVERLARLALRVLLFAAALIVSYLLGAKSAQYGCPVPLPREAAW